MIFGNNDDDYICGDYGTNFLTGDGGNTLFGGSGDDHLFGGADNDFLRSSDDYFDCNERSDVIVDYDLKRDTKLDKCEFF
ncbi:MAG: hypothetical protein ACPKPY_10940 [Nitrososphaeraceae archaeon]